MDIPILNDSKSIKGRMHIDSVDFWKKSGKETNIKAISWITFSYEMNEPQYLLTIMFCSGKVHIWIKIFKI